MRIPFLLNDCLGASTTLVFARGHADFPMLLGRLIAKIALFAPGGFSVRPWLQRLRGVVIGKNVWISQFVYVDEIHPEDVSIGDNCVIGLRTSIISHFYSGPRKPMGNGKVVIEKDVFIGPHCVTNFQGVGSLDIGIPWSVRKSRGQVSLFIYVMEQCEPDTVKTLGLVKDN